METKTTQSTVEQLKEKLNSERKEREDLCGKDISEILEKYNCSLDVRVILSKTGVTPDIIIMAND